MRCPLRGLIRIEVSGEGIVASYAPPNPFLLYRADTEYGLLYCCVLLHSDVVALV